MVQLTTLIAIAAISFYPVVGISLDESNPGRISTPLAFAILQYLANPITDSIKAAASTIAANVVSWSSSLKDVNAVTSVNDWATLGIIAGGLIQYEELTGDTQYNHLVVDLITSHIGPRHDFMLSNPNLVLVAPGYWALAAAAGAETQAQSSDSARAWLNPAETVFNDYTSSWNETGACNGGLPQFIIAPRGSDFKTTATNGAFFSLAARLAHSTGNFTYIDWATKVFDWSLSVGLVDDNSWAVNGFVVGDDNCTSVNKSPTSINTAFYLSGAAHMYNVTIGATQAVWKRSLDGLVAYTASSYFPDGIATEHCNLVPIANCTAGANDFRGLLGSALIDTIRVAPHTSAILFPLLVSTAKAAADTCSQGPNGTSCSSVWTGEPDKNFTAALGSDLSTLIFVQALLVNATAPTTDTLSLGNGTATEGSGPDSTTSGAGTPSSTPNAGVALTANVASVGVWAGMFSMIAWLML